MGDNDKLSTYRRTSIERRTEPERLRDLLLGWLSAKKQSTQETYRSDLEDFARFCGVATVDEALIGLWGLTVPNANALVLDYRTDMLERPVWRSRHARDAGDDPERIGLASATINRRLAALRSITVLAQTAGMFNGQLTIRGLKVRKYRDTRGLGEDAYHRLLADLDAEIAQWSECPGEGYDWAKQGLAIRDRAMVRLLHDVGLRRVEVVRLDMADVMLDYQTLILRPKGGRDAMMEIEIGDRAWSALQSWIQYRGAGPGPLFHGLGRRGRMHVDTINKTLRRREVEGIKIRPHGFRHTGATTVAKRTGKNLMMVQQWLRHSDPKTSQVYLDNLDDSRRELQNLIAEPEDDE